MIETPSFRGIRIGTIEVRAARSLSDLGSEWDELCDELGAPIFLRPGWVSAWLGSFAAGRVRILEARSKGRLVGVLPVHADRRGGWSASNWYSPAAGMLAHDEAVVRAFAAALYSTGMPSLQLGFLDHDQAFADAAVATLSEAGWRVRQRVLERWPYVAIAGDDWSTYRSKRSGNMLRDLRRRRRRLEELGTVSFEVVDGTAGLDRLLDECFELEAKGWKGARGVAVLSDVRTERFFRQLADWAARRGWLRLAFLRLEGTPIAMQYAFEHEGMYVQKKIGHDPAFSRYAPGRLLLQYTIERAFVLGLSSYEFLSGEEPYKLEWTSTARTLSVIEGFAPSLTGLARLASVTTGRSALRATRAASPFLGRLLGRDRQPPLQRNRSTTTRR